MDVLRGISWLILPVVGLVAGAKIGQALDLPGTVTGLLAMLCAFGGFVLGVLTVKMGP